jgi:hypothetical protein
MPSQIFIILPILTNILLTPLTLASLSRDINDTSFPHDAPHPHYNYTLGCSLLSKATATAKDPLGA